MKKIAVILACVAVFFSFGIQRDFIEKLDFSSGKVFIHTSAVPTANSVVLAQTLSHARELEKQKIYGVTYKTVGNQDDANKLLKKFSARVVEKNEHNDYIEILAYSSKIKGVECQNSRFNIQLIIKNGELILGYPTVLEGF